MEKYMISLALDDLQDSEMLCGYARQAMNDGNTDFAAFFKDRAKLRMKQFWDDMARISRMTDSESMCRAFVDAQKERVSRMEYEVEHMK
ncbi:MAG TPA: hypothetical protein H9810_01155 [Candidatus Gemmiger excrementavium]|uniref:Uncharacterized protein n=1 Tax=Candidatus Gemmiger excrementavium TaxID=2838608 RepID=A0A9D2F0I4_9FIRM|nr:hypothetical protein [Candidatus Gemmiger excrementavium]